MANLKISAATPKAALATTDMIPLAASGDATAYHVTGQEIVDLVSAEITALPALTSAADLAQLGQVVRVGTDQSDPGAIKISSLLGVDWLIVANQSTYSGHPEDMLFIGYNPRSDPEGASYQDPAKHKWYIALESDYWPDVSTHVAEWYVQYIAAGTEDYNRRPIHAVVNLDTHALEVFFKGKIYWWTSDGAQVSLMQLEDNTVGRLYMYNYGIRSANNNVPLLSQKNASGTYVDLLKLNSTDQIQLEQPTTTAQDISISDAAKGVVLKDRTNGNTYRLKVDSGTLGVEQVT